MDVARVVPGDAGVAAVMVGSLGKFPSDIGSSVGSPPPSIANDSNS